MTDLPPNPKQAFGDRKPNLALNPGVASAYQALALECGAAKYGPFNWREKSVEVMTYVAAAKRHLDAWVDGEEYSSDTAHTNRPVHNLGHVQASIAILIDAIECGCAIDNRPIGTNASSILHDRIAEQRRAAQEPPPPVVRDFSGEPHPGPVPDVWSQPPADLCLRCYRLYQDCICTPG